MKVFEVTLGQGEAVITRYAVAMSADAAVDLVIHAQPHIKRLTREHLASVKVLLEGAEVVMGAADKNSPPSPRSLVVMPDTHSRPA